MIQAVPPAGAEAIETSGSGFASLEAKFHTVDSVVNALKGISCSVRKRECFAFVGESGSKTKAVLSILRLTQSPPGISPTAALRSWERTCSSSPPFYSHVPDAGGRWRLANLLA
ncbi:hypothetical protein [Devosia psychrophila]|uniref:Uncharacterized protein n=1 Tax=Devosia psychrophila TaxID=728005 RepID=A0A0F5Q1H9_9HYPH|nr:hypothetical protein [Devosia psychrophila]KKC33934.1 hypothetical protein WH91_05950 [Devosia psychrophila]SFC85017.1 hypothetical protein SAMN04488059_112106 [Devosia psychrophila]